MYYRLCIMKVEANPAFDQQKFDEWKSRQQRNYPYGEPYTVPAEQGTRMLEVVVTENEFDRIKQAVLTEWQ